MKVAALLFLFSEHTAVFYGMLVLPGGMDMGVQVGGGMDELVPLMESLLHGNRQREKILSAAGAVGNQFL